MSCCCCCLALKMKQNKTKYCIRFVLFLSIYMNTNVMESLFFSFVNSLIFDWIFIYILCIFYVYLCIRLSLLVCEGSRFGNLLSFRLLSFWLYSTLICFGRILFLLVYFVKRITLRGIIYIRRLLISPQNKIKVI